MRAERAARVVLVAGLAPVPVAAALLIWIFGFDHKPRHVAFGCTIAAVFAVLMVCVQLILYLTRVRAIARR